MNLKEMQEQYNKLLEDIAAKRAPFNESDKMMSAVEQEECGKMFDDLDGLKVNIDGGLAQQKLDSRASEHKSWQEQPDVTPAADAVMKSLGGDRGRKDIVKSEAENAELKLKVVEEARRAGFKSWMQSGMAYLGEDEGATAFKALQADSDTRGGYLVMPRMVTQALIEEIDDAVFIRQLATVHSIERAQSLGAPTRDNDVSDPVWTNEIGTGDLDDTEPFGMRELSPNPLAKRIKISNTLLNAPGIDIEQYWRGRLAYKFSVAMENGFLTGNGRNQPLGLLVPSDSGIPTSRDVKTGSNTDFTADGLVDAQYNQKQAYWARCRWLFSRDAVKRIRLLKDAENVWLWQPGIQPGQPAMILGFPFIMSEFMPMDFSAAGRYVGLFADFSWYWVADALQMQTQRLVELYAEKNQTGFIARMESDGQPMLAEAFTRIVTGV